MGCRVPPASTTDHWEFFASRLIAPQSCKICGKLYHYTSTRTMGSCSPSCAVEMSHVLCNCVLAWRTGHSDTRTGVWLVTQGLMPRLDESIRHSAGSFDHGSGDFHFLWTLDASGFHAPPIPWTLFPSLVTWSCGRRTKTKARKAHRLTHGARFG